MEENDNRGTINDIFDNTEDDSIPLEHQLWGKNPKRVEALKDLWLKDMTEFIEKNGIPDEGLPDLMFSMVANNMLDMIMESLPEDLSLELSYCFDHMLGVFIANKRYGVDILDAAYQSLIKVDRNEFDSDEEFEAAVNEREERWWTVGKQVLSGRSPNDVIAEALSRYGLNR